MRTDIHVHVPELPSERGNQGVNVRTRWLLRLFLRHYGLSPGDLLDERASTGIRGEILRWIECSQMDRAVLLALDDPRDDYGLPIPGRFLYSARNEAVSALAASSPKLLFGASVHPYRRDAVQELLRQVKRGACLVKWLPSAQNIDLEDRRCIPFYDAMAALRLPLLAHTGNEHTVHPGDNGLNRPKKLLTALSRGVTVIAAHCGKRLYLHERCFFMEWKRMALQHERFYGDLSAFLSPVRLPALREIARTPALCAKVVYGSDFPTVPWVPGLAFWAGKRAARSVRECRNPFDFPWRALQALGIPDGVFSRAYDLLRIADKSSAAIGSAP